MSEQTPHDQELTPPVERGKGWVCDNGHKHFVCYGCGGVFIASEAVDHGEHTVHDDEGNIDEEENFSLCDDCAEKLITHLRAQGVDI